MPLLRSRAPRRQRFFGQAMDVRFGVMAVRLTTGLAVRPVVANQRHGSQGPIIGVVPEPQRKILDELPVFPNEDGEL